jgi:hypothetical protein
VSLSSGAISTVPIESEPSVSVFADQVPPPSLDFHKPPPEKATMTLTLAGSVTIALTRPASVTFKVPPLIA